MSQHTPITDPFARSDRPNGGSLGSTWRPPSEARPAADHRRTRPMSHAELLKPADVCAQLKVSRAWLYRAAADGRIPSLRLGGPDGPLRFEPLELAAWIERSRAAWRPGDSSTATLRRVS